MNKVKKMKIPKIPDFSDFDSGHEEDDSPDHDIYNRQISYPPFPAYDPPSDFSLPDNKKVSFHFKSSSSSSDHYNNHLPPPPPNGHSQPPSPSLPPPSHSNPSPSHHPPLNRMVNSFHLSSLSEHDQSEKSEVSEEEEEEEEDEEEEEESDVEQSDVGELSEITENEEKSEAEEKNNKPTDIEEEDEDELEEEEEDEDGEGDDEGRKGEENNEGEEQEGGVKNETEGGEKEEKKKEETFVKEADKYNEHDMEFAVMIEECIEKIHESKVQASEKTEMANRLAEFVGSVSPATLTKNLAQLIPLITSIASENNFTTSLSILNTINTFAQRFKQLQSPNCDLTWLIRRLCTFASESRSTLRTEGFMVLKNVISGFGIDYVLQPFVYILSDFGVKGGGRIKSIAVDALSYCLILFPRNSFDFSLLSEWACKMLWNSKRRVRQAAFELIALIVHSIGTVAAMALFREYTERPQASSTQSSSENISEEDPLKAITARISRHQLPTVSHAGLVDYGLIIPFQAVVKKSQQQQQHSATTPEDPVLQPLRSGNNKQRSNGADVDWILQAKGPLVRSSVDHHNNSNSLDKEFFSEEDKLDKLSHHNNLYSSSSASSSSSQRNALPLLFSGNDVKHFEPSFQQTFQVYRMDSLYSYNPQTPPTPPQPQQPPPLPDSRDSRLFSRNWKSSFDIPSSDEFGNYPESDFLYRKPVLARQLRRKESPKSSSHNDVQLQDVSSVSSEASEKISDDFLANLKVTDYAAIPIPTTKKYTQRRPKKLQTRKEPAARKKKEETNTLQKCLAKLNSSDWTVNIEGFSSLSQLMDSEDLKPELPLINKTALKHLTNLRSQVCRAACAFFRDLFRVYGKAMETDCEKILEKLLDKTCDVNKFIREDAAAAVMEACEVLSFQKIFACFDAFGVKHRNPVVRATTARMISHLVTKHGLEKSMDMGDKLLPVLVRFLQEGSLETRTHAKETIGALMADSTFDDKLKKFVSPELLRAVSKNINAIRNRL